MFVLSQHEDPSSNPQHPIKKQKKLGYSHKPIILVLWEDRERRVCPLAASLAPRFLESPRSQENRVQSDSVGQVLWPPCGHMDTGTQTTQRKMEKVPGMWRCWLQCGIISEHRVSLTEEVILGKDLQTLRRGSRGRLGRAPAAVRTQVLAC